MTTPLLGIGTALPSGEFAQSDAAAIAASFCDADPHQADLLRVLFRRTSVARRRTVLLEPGEGADAIRRFYPSARDCVETRGGQGPTTAERMQMFGRCAPPLATAACRNALTDAAIAPSAVTHLVTVSCTGFAAPGVEAALIASLGLPRSVGRTAIGFMGCHGALNGLQTAASIIGADDSARVLLCAVELCTLHLQYGWHPERIVANALFADGAGAVVLGRDPGASWALVDTASRLIDETAGEMTWNIGDHGFVMTLSSRVPRILSDHLRPWIDEWLAAHGRRVADIGSWAIHAGGPRVVDAVQTRLDLTSDASRAARTVLHDHGNMSSATILFILERLRRERAPLPCVAIGFGPGLVVEAALFDED